MARKIPFAGIALVCSVVMLFFTFFAWGWFSDARGLEAYFEIPIGTEHSALSTLADALWMATPFLLLISSFLILSPSPTHKRIALIFTPIPLGIYAFFQILLFLGEKEGHFSILITLFFILFTSCLTILSAFIPELGRFAGQSAMCHVLVEIILVILSFVFQEKFSQFYFSQLLPMGHLSGFRYSFFLISVCLYYLSYSLFLACLNFSDTAKKEKKSKPEEPKKEESEPEPDSDAEKIPLDLADFGIEK